jgi:hypothetical protein
MKKNIFLFSVGLVLIVIIGWMLYPKKIAIGQFTLNGGGIECRCIGFPYHSLGEGLVTNELPKCLGWRLNCKPYSISD